MTASKTCVRCRETKSTSEFYGSKINRDGLDGRCKPCHAAYRQAYYQRNKEKYSKRNKENRAIQKEEVRRIVWDYLLAHPCIACGEGNPIVLEFDHRDPKTKKFEVAKMLNLPVERSQIVSEIAKCDVLCANCHRIKTAQDNNYWRHEWYATHLKSRQ